MGLLDRFTSESIGCTAVIERDSEGDPVLCESDNTGEASGPDGTYYYCKEHRPAAAIPYAISTGTTEFYVPETDEVVEKET